jgi:type II secretion system protein J
MKIRMTNDEIRKPARRIRGGNGEVSSFVIRHSSFGFTLIEMILAIGVAAIVLIAVNAALFTALHLRNDAADMVDEATPVDSTVSFLKRDLQGCVTPTNGTSKVLSGSFRVGNSMSSAGLNDPVQIEMFTTTGALSGSQPWGEIQRVTYELKDPANASVRGKYLYRSVLRNLLAVSPPQAEEQFMLGGVESLKISCYDGAQWQETWDTTSISTLNTNLPLAVKVEIRMAGQNNNVGEPIQLVVPIDAVVRTNMVFASTGN